MNPFFKPTPSFVLTFYSLHVFISLLLPFFSSCNSSTAQYQSIGMSNAFGHELILV